MKRVTSTLNRLRRQPSLDADVLALNLSYVLHEHSMSDAVVETVRICQRHAARVRNVDTESLKILPAADMPAEGQALVLTAQVGAPALLARYLAQRYPHHCLLFTDQIQASHATVRLFRADARLTIPTVANQDLSVAGLVLRPGYRSAQLVQYGPYVWPRDRDQVLRSLERLIQAYADQWMPSHALWPVPAESALASEITTDR